ncbi:hypothetical protein [Streptacidiphilus anmyonensis]|uniref:hypothetical protein n=1 Tax=Streptacidiphilus anmyonensis TaxID=405782 RepID=UPI0005A77017|nr:hypothetical protein [Streptacidiphilus anmyonensis]
MTDHRSPATPTTGNPLSPHAADVLAWALGSPLPVPAEQAPAPTDTVEQADPVAPVEDDAPADATQTAAPEERPDVDPGPHAGIEPPAAPEPERAEESAPTPEEQRTADGGAERPHAAPEFPGSHIGRSFAGTEIEDECPCPQEACGLVDPMRADPECDQHGRGARKTMRQGHRSDQCPGPRPEITPMEALRQRADQARTNLHRLGAMERRQARELGYTRERITSAQAELQRMVDELLAMIEEPPEAPAAPEPAPVAEPSPAAEEAPAPLAIEPPASPETSAAEQVEAPEESREREALLRVLDNQAAEIHPQFGPHGPYPHTRTGDARADWVASWLGSAPAARFRAEQLAEAGWQRAPLTDPDGETSAWTVARTLATLRNGTPVEWTASGAVSAPRLRWTPVADCRTLSAGARIDWAREFTGASALFTPDSRWNSDPRTTSTAEDITAALRELSGHVDMSERAGELKVFTRDGAYRFTPRR